MRYRVNHPKCGKLWGCGCWLSHFAAFCLLARRVKFSDVHFKLKLVAVALLIQKLLKKGEKQKIQNHLKSWFWRTTFESDFWNALNVFCNISWLEWARELYLVPNWLSFQAAYTRFIEGLYLLTGHNENCRVFGLICEYVDINDMASAIAKRCLEPNK